MEFSDHHPILISLDEKVMSLFLNPFRFECAWMAHPSYLLLLQNSWQNDGPFMNNIQLKNNLVVWRMKVFGSIRGKKNNLIGRMEAF